ncbi:MAG: hypothetical protein JWP97_6301 [Labilithrix sp.]|nr:hypothetical protein [Labilithrix sp.]
MGYLAYYLIPIALGVATENPELAGIALVIWLCRGFLPDPVVWLRTMGRMRRLENDIKLNPANLQATRALALLFLERKRPKRAITLIEQTRQRMADSTRHPQGSRDDAELLFALGVAKLGAGDAEGALQPLISAVAIAPDVGRGDPYLVAGDALTKLGRWEEAEDSYARYLEHNSSSVEAFVKLARARSKQKDEPGRDEAIQQAKHTWGVLPGFKRRKEWRWFAAALTAGLWL